MSPTFDPQARGRSSGRPRADYGSWESPISVAALAEVGEAWARFDRPEPTSTGTYWLEARPTEGRTVLLYQPLGGTAREVVNGVDVGTEVHEYGGGGYFLDGSTVYFSNRVDGRLYRYADGVDRAPRPISPLPEFPRALRYADGIAIPGGEWVVCVRETHAAESVWHELVVLAAGSGAEPRALVSDHDFVSSPCVSPDGTQLAWMTWDHPSMPFHATDLWLADLSDDGSVGAPAHVAGGSEESIFQPQWSPEGELYYVSDRTGWWNLYRLREGRHDAVCPLAAEVGWPQWWCSLSSYAFLADGTLACLVNWGSRQELAVIDPEAGTLRQVSLPFTAVARPQLRAHGTRVVFVGASTIEAPTLVAWDPSRDTYDVLARSVEPLPGVGWISRPSSISLARPGGGVVRASYFPPTNPDFEAADGELPPLVVLAHGGPTDQAAQGARLEIQFLTTRGLGVLDVDYGGSTGFGRADADRLRGRWGVIDTEDCVAATLHLVEKGRVDARRIAIVGGSAGGYIVLCALVDHDVFAAGVCLYGIAELETFAAETHAFESGYVDWLVGPLPEAADVYRNRSPARHASRVSSPLLLLQGLDDRVVPPSQSEAMAAALDAAGRPVQYESFPGEGHGFKRSAAIGRSYEVLLRFLGESLGFEPSPVGSLNPPKTTTL